MGEERLKILKMLEDGKINAEDAARLLASVGAACDEKRDTGRDFGEQFAREDRDIKPEGGFGHERDANTEGGGEARFDSFAREMSRKMGVVMRDLEPKLRKFTSAAAEGVTNATDVVRAGIERERERNRERDRWRAEHHRRPATAPRPIRQDAPRQHGLFEKNFEIPVEGDGARLSIAGLNGAVRIKGYNGGTITAVVRYKPRREGAVPDFSAYGDKYMLVWDEDDFKSIAIDAYIPQNAFETIGISSDNGAVLVSNIETQALRVETTNGAVTIDGVCAEEIVSESQNAAVEFTNIYADKASVEGFNGRVFAENIDVSRFSLTTFNGALEFRAARLTHYTDYKWNFESANGKLMINVPGGAGYHVKARTALADVRVNLPDMRFIADERHHVEARSNGFEAAPVKVELTAETSNAALIIN